MARTPQNGDFYIQRSNQDFWLRESGVWVRKGNIRDEGAQGVLVINPIVGQGYDQSNALTRERFIEFDQAFAFGFDAAGVVSRSREVQASMGFGVDDTIALLRTRELSVAINLGFDVASQFGIDLGNPAILDQNGFSQANTLTHANTTPTRTSLTTFASSGNDGSAATTPSFNPAAGTMIILDIAREGTGNVTSTTTVTDNKGLTWTKQSESAHFHSIPGFWYRVERWWAYNASAQTGMTVSFTFNRAGAAANNVYASVYDYTNIGKANGGTPFLAGGSATATQDSNTASAVTANATPGGTSPTVLLGALVYRDANTPPTAGSTYTQINRLGNQTSSGAMSFIDEELISTSSISSPHAVTITSNQAFWEYVVDVIDGS